MTAPGLQDPEDDKDGKMNIITIGTTYVDIKGFPETVFIPEGRNAGSVELTAGGVGRNIAENIANCGQTSVFLSTVDHSSLSEGVLKHFRDNHISTEYMTADDKGLGTWLAIFNEKGDVVSSISRRPRLDGILRTLNSRGDELFEETDSIIIESDIDDSIIEKVFALADKYHKTVYAVVANMSLAMRQLPALRRSGCFICNLQEAGMLAGKTLENKSDSELLKETANLAEKLGFQRFVVTRGEKGAVYVDRIRHAEGFAGAEPTEVVDTTGAGDAFFSGVVLGLTGGLSLKEACRIGAKLAASAISGVTNVCRKQHPEELLKKI